MNYRNDATTMSSAINLTSGFRGLLRNPDGTNCTYERHARLVLQTQLHEVVIDIIGSQCCLVKPDRPYCSDLLGKPFSPGSLLRRLQRKGIHLLPTEVDLAAVNGKHTKIRVLEEQVWRQIAQSASALDFCSSPWNLTLNESQIGILAREASVYSCPAELNDYECILVERDEVTVSYLNTPDLGIAPGVDGVQYLLVLGNDYGRRPLFSPIPRPDEMRHLELSRTLDQRISPEAMQRLRRCNQRFVKTVYTLLSLLKPYSQV
jgi:hypothetical protein